MSRLGSGDIYSYDDNSYLTELWNKKYLYTDTNESGDIFEDHANDVLLDYSPDPVIFDDELTRDTSAYSRRVMDSRYKNMEEREQYIPDLWIHDNSTDGQQELNLNQKAWEHTSSRMRSLPLSTSSDATIHTGIKTGLQIHKDLVKNRGINASKFRTRFHHPMKSVHLSGMHLTPQPKSHQHNSLTSHVRDTMIMPARHTNAGREIYNSNDVVHARKESDGITQSHKMKYSIEGMHGKSQQFINEKSSNMVDVSHKSNKELITQIRNKQDLGYALQNLTKSRRDGMIDHKGSATSDRANTIKKNGIVNNVLNFFKLGERTDKGPSKSSDRTTMIRKSVETMDPGVRENAILDHKVLRALEKEGHIKKNAAGFISTDSKVQWNGIISSDKQLKHSKEVSSKFYKMIAEPTYRDQEASQVDVRGRVLITPSNRKNVQQTDGHIIDNSIQTHTYKEPGVLTRRTGVAPDTYMVSKARETSTFNDDMVF